MALWQCGNMAGMAYVLNYADDASAVLDALEASAELAAASSAVVRTLHRLEDDPCNRRLGTTSYITPELGGINATPARLDDWYVLWQRAPEVGELDIIAIAQVPV
jgi:hypothetical protein